MQTSSYLRIIAIIFVNIAMLTGLVGAFLSLTEPDLLFNQSMQLYGPLRNNLIFVLLYVSITEIALFFLQFHKTLVTESLIVGPIMILIAFGTIFYSQVNQIPFSTIIFAGCLFIGAGHLFYYFMFQFFILNNDTNK